MTLFSNHCKDFVINKTLEIFIFIQFLVCVCAFLVFPTFDCFLSITIWFNLVVLFYFLYLLNFPIFAITAAYVFIFKLVLLVKSGLFLNIIFFLMCLLVIFTVLFFVLKDSQIFISFKDQVAVFKTLEVCVETKLKVDFSSFGALSQMLSWIFVVCNFCYYIDSESFLFFADLYSAIVAPLACVFATFFIISSLIELVMALIYRASFLTGIIFILIKLTKIVFGLLILGISFHNHTVGGVYEPIIYFTIVRQYQKYFLGAVGADSSQVRALRLFKTFGTNEVPPRLEGSDFVDLGKLNALNSSLLEKQASDIITAKKIVEEALKGYEYDFTRTDDENLKKMREITFEYIDLKKNNDKKL